MLTKCDKTKEIAKRRKGRLTNDGVPSRDNAVKDAIKHDPMRKQGGHDLPYQPAECSSLREERKVKKKKYFQNKKCVPSKIYVSSIIVKLLILRRVQYE